MTGPGDTSAMSFALRPMRLDDFEDCFAMLRERFVYDAPAKRGLLALWRRQLESGDGILGAIEDRRRTPARCVGFGTMAFATDPYMSWARNSSPPFLALGALEALTRKPRPFLTKEKVRQANAGEGVNIVILNSSWDEDGLTPEEGHRVRQLIMESFQVHFNGYRIREVLMEVYGPLSKAAVTSGGAILRRDYRDVRDLPCLAQAGADRWPYLFGFTREEALGQEGTQAALVCSKALAPRFGFSVSEREMIQKAMGGATDEELAEALHVTLWTVKKRWQAVYQRVEAVDPGLLESSPSAASRVPQKRRRLLDFLRQNMSEIRPADYGPVAARPA